MLVNLALLLIPATSTLVPGFLIYIGAAWIVPELVMPTARISTGPLCLIMVMVVLKSGNFSHATIPCTDNESVWCGVKFDPIHHVFVIPPSVAATIPGFSVTSYREQW